MSFDVDLIVETEDRVKLEQDKHDWIFLYGSDLLQRSMIQGYDSERRYVAERLAIEHPGFKEPAQDKLIRKTDSPPDACLKACAKYEGSYCSEMGFYSPRYYVTFDNYLGSHQIIKAIPHPYQMSKSDRLYSQKDWVLRPIGALGLLFTPLVLLVMTSAPHSCQPLTPAQEQLTRELLAPVPIN
ncbi:hypothetical protein [Chamaesiphon sp.]|uniref:hypothetical protein n=1 Tax=Chamaesiphon sp. TaxID=2814140 RepID=UPI0035944DAB